MIYLTHPFKIMFLPLFLPDEMNKTRSHLHMFSKKIIVALNLHRLFLSFFGPVRFTSAQLTSSPLFSLSSVVSPPTDIITQLHHVMLPSYETKTSLLHLIHLPTTLHPVGSPLEPKLKQWICTTAAGHPPRTARLRLPPSTTIKSSS
jgi:hypothetical protein